MQHEARPAVLSLVVWSALIPIVPFMAASFILEGPQAMLKSPVEIDLTTILSLITAFVASIIGYGIWGSLLGRYETGAWRRYRCWYRWSGLPAPHCCWMKRSARCNCVAQG